MITVKYIVRYNAVYTIPPNANVALACIRRGSGVGSTLFVRQDYTYKEAEATASWLNERSAGYPVPASLAYIAGSGHDERNGSDKRRRVTRRKGGTPRK